jgi:eukaryotic-like serine/threonine-protein kinase
VGTRLGRYEVIRTLATGALTDLVLGRASGMEGFQRHVAIKRLREEHASDPAVLEMFVNEARLAAALHHHNIVQVLDIGDAGGEPFFAMEYVHGVDLRTLLGHLAKRSEQLPFSHVVSIIASAAAALHHAHEQRNPDGAALGIVHRQVTPSNILVGYDGNVKIVDFGIAKAAIKRSETGVGVLRGSAPYMAPEQCAGQRVDRRSDVFALGIVLYELSTVRRLFKGANEFLTMSAVVNAEVPRPSQYRRDVPPDLEVVMLKALARDPLARYQTAGDMAEALDRVARSVGVGASTTQLANYMKLQFGDQKEPWLDPAAQFQEITAVDFDGAASGLAPPPAEAVKNFAIPKTIAATKSSPIHQARASAATPARPKGKTLPPPDRSFNVPTAVDSPRRAKTEVDADTDVSAAPPAEPLPLPKQKTNVAAPPPPPPGIEPTRPSKNDMTQVVEPLSVIAARAQTVLPEKRRAVIWLALAALAAAGIVAAIALWPSSELAPSTASTTAPTPAAAAEVEVAPPAKSAMEMTARDYEAARAEIDAGVAEVVPVEPLDAAVTVEAPVADEEIVLDEKQAAPEPVETKPVKQAVRPAIKPTKRTTKPAAKRTAKPATTKKPAAKKTKTKPKWNPDDLFIGE